MLEHRLEASNVLGIWQRIHEGPRYGNHTQYDYPLVFIYAIHTAALDVVGGTPRHQRRARWLSTMFVVYPVSTSSCCCRPANSSSFRKLVFR